MPDAHALLSECSHVRCAGLCAFLGGVGDQTDLVYEDVFYPLRHHAYDDLMLITSKQGQTARRIYWGGGDILYERRAEGEVDEPVRPRNVWHPIEAGVVDIDYVCWEGFD